MWILQCWNGLQEHTNSKHAILPKQEAGAIVYKNIKDIMTVGKRKVSDETTDTCTTKINNTDESVET